jgi:hypothetical protein
MPKVVDDGDGLEALITFRLKPGDMEGLVDLVNELKVIGVRSHNQMARKIVTDFLHGRLVYLRQADKYAESVNANSTPMLRVPPAALPPTPGKR